MIKGSSVSILPSYGRMVMVSLHTVMSTTSSYQLHQAVGKRNSRSPCEFAGKRVREPLYFFSYGGPRGESCVSRLWSSVSRGCSAKDCLQHICWQKKYLNISKYHGCLLKQGRCESRIDNIISKVERTISKVQLTMEIFEKFLFSKKYQENIFLVKSLIH